MPWEAAVTSYTREQIQHLDWENRNYISDLVTIERIVLAGGPANWAEAILFRNLCERHPVAARRIKDELRPLSPADRDQRIAEREAAIKVIESRVHRYREAMERLQTEREAEERRLWQAAGGQP